jgi:hypothetical protein
MSKVSGGWGCSHVFVRCASACTYIVAVGKGAVECCVMRVALHVTRHTSHVTRHRHVILPLPPHSSLHHQRRRRLPRAMEVYPFLPTPQQPQTNSLSSQMQRRLLFSLWPLLPHGLPHCHRLLLHRCSPPARHPPAPAARSRIGMYSAGRVSVHASPRTARHCCTGRWKVCCCHQHHNILLRLPLILHHPPPPPFSRLHNTPSASLLPMPQAPSPSAPSPPSKRYSGCPATPLACNRPPPPPAVLL